MISFKRVLAGAAMGALSAMAGLPVQAAFVGHSGPTTQNNNPPPATWLDTGASIPVLIYDSNYYSASEGRLVLVASATALSGPGVPSAPNPLQPYGADGALDQMLSLRINNATGALISGTVAVTPGTDADQGDSWQFVGNVDAFGFSNFSSAAATTNGFDARFTVTSYNLSDVVQGLVGSGSINPDAPVTCTVGPQAWCGRGYLKINTANIGYVSNTEGADVNFGVDWVRGSSVSAALAASPLYAQFFAANPDYLPSGIAAGAYANAANTTADIFMTVPVPGAFALFAAGLVGLGPLARRRRRGP